ncbi:SurA N-terminal domain-containing protein [Lentzea sp. NPDC004789]
MSTVLKRFSLVGVAVALLATGCGTGPAKAGSAAIVGDQAITLETVQDRTVRVLNKEPGAKQARDRGQFKLEQISRAVLANEILHRFAENAAQRENITVDETKVYDVVQQAGGPEAASADSLNDATNIHRQVRDGLIFAELARRNLATLQVTMDFVSVKDPKEARKMAEQVAADPAKMEEFIQAAPRSTQGSQLSGRDQQLRISENASLAGTPLWAVKPGTVVVFKTNDQSATSEVALVKDRKTLPAVPGEDDIADRADPKLLFDFGKRIAQYLAADLSMEVNPRYGVWDPIDTMVKPSEGELSGFIGPVATKNKS